MKSRNIIILLSIVFCVFIGLYFFNSDKNETSQMDNNKESNSIEERISPLGMGDGFWDEAISPFREEEPKPYLEILEDLKTGKINFVWEVWAMRRKCNPDYTPDQCNQTILAYIDSEYASPDKEKLKELFVSYFKYEEEYRKWEQPTDLSFNDLYEKIKQKRREILKENADLIFGMEESQVSFLEGSQNIIKETSNLSGDERVKKYQDFKQKTYGPYYKAMVTREDNFQNYETEKLLREKELNNLSQLEEREKFVNKLETKYFGKEKADAMAADRKRERLAVESIQNYESKEKEFLRLNPSMNETEKMNKLKELRIKILGSEEEADAYIRRKNIEEAGKI
ncbi:lipase secretion chaperone [Leptospira sp. 96542]|nr:lipase secretion chaperone [Leptospira sp. 96542]